MHHIHPSHRTKLHFVLLANASKQGGENFAQSRPSHFISAFFPSFDITATPTFVSRLHIFAVSIFKRFCNISVEKSFLCTCSSVLKLPMIKKNIVPCTKTSLT
ncbi:hypothetical protein Tsp_10508 [Trichinella spiralis]|uniref:hypothetical protein n=1 Tax=Trichinella spiralis TaxID=6334 RepID=UPI0001EFD38E|nr:hypothetical protein Tsp_10508 [Trichinella spiralis]